MKNKITIIVLLLFYCSSLSFAQTATQKRAAANALWTNMTYKKSNKDPLRMPAAIPRYVSQVETRTIVPTYEALKETLKELAKENGGMILFKNKGIIKFPLPTATSPISYFNITEDYRTRAQVKTIVIQASGIIFDGQKKSSMFHVRGSLRLIIQDAIFRNASLHPQIANDTWKGKDDKGRVYNLGREGGAAIEVGQIGPNRASLRVRNCRFFNNEIPRFRKMGENHNGAAIRFNSKTTGEIFGCFFKNNVAVTGGAVAGTSVNKLTIINSLFDSNVANSYQTKGGAGYLNVVEGGGAIRVDRTVKPIEIYGSTFKNNSSNVKASTIQVYIRPVAEESGNYPGKKSLVIAHCYFTGNKHHRFPSAINPDRSASQFTGCIVFQTSGVRGSFQGGELVMSNTIFHNNEAGQANIRIQNNFKISNTIFSNTIFLGKRVSNVNSIQTGAVFVHDVYTPSLFDKCIFYNNKPLAGARASDIMFWSNNIESKVSLRNTIFSRTNTNTTIALVHKTLKGGNNQQYTSGVKLPKVSSGYVSEVNPLLRQSFLKNDLIFGQKIWKLKLCTEVASTRGTKNLKECSKARITAVKKVTTEIVLYPNPATNIINIMGATAGKYITVYNIYGQTVLRIKSAGTSNKLPIDNLKSGVYTVFIDGKTLRFIKK